MNLSDALDKYFKSVSKEIKKVITEKTDEILTLFANKYRCNEYPVINLGHYKLPQNLKKSKSINDRILSKK